MIALSCIELKKYDSAISYLKKAIRFASEDLDIYYCNIGNAYKARQKYFLASKNYLKSLKINPNCFESYNNLGSIFLDFHKYEKAINFFLKAMILKPESCEILNNLGILFYKLKKYDKAYKYSSKALKYNKLDYKVYFNLGNICKQVQKYEKTLKFYNEALKIFPNNTKVLNNIGEVFFKTQKNEDSIKCYKKAMSLDPNYHESFYNLSLLQLHLNSFKEGWSNFSRRWHVKDFPSEKQDYKIPSFNFSSHKSVLVWPEQGIGDQILFSRFFNNLRNSDIKVYSSTDKKLLPLFQVSFPFINFVSSGDKLTTQSQSSIGGLGKFFINSKEDLENNSSAYLSVNKDKSSALKAQFPKGKKVCGLSWFSKNDDLGEHKSLSLKKLEKFLKLKDITFVDLQYGDTSKERQSFCKKYGINLIKIKEIDNYDDIEGLAALIDACDFVVTVSNTTAHIAGAIGKKTYLMLPKGKGKLWYWSKENDQSLWYKSIKIMEQKEIGQWNTVIDELCAQKLVV